MDSEAPSRVCLIDFGAVKVVCDQLVKPPSTITDYVSHLVSLQVICLSRTHPQSQISCNNSRSARPHDKDAAEVQMYLLAPMKSSTSLLGHSLDQI